MARVYKKDTNLRGLWGGVAGSGYSLPGHTALTGEFGFSVLKSKFAARWPRGGGPSRVTEKSDLDKNEANHATQ